MSFYGGYVILVMTMTGKSGYISSVLQQPHYPIWTCFVLTGFLFPSLTITQPNNFLANDLLTNDLLTNNFLDLWRELRYTSAIVVIREVYIC